jgi:hypothetical protein
MRGSAVDLSEHVGCTDAARASPDAPPAAVPDARNRTLTKAYVHPTRREPECSFRAWWEHPWGPGGCSFFRVDLALAPASTRRRRRAPACERRACTATRIPSRPSGSGRIAILLPDRDPVATLTQSRPATQQHRAELSTSRPTSRRPSARHATAGPVIRFPPGGIPTVPFASGRGPVTGPATTTPAQNPSPFRAPSRAVHPLGPAPIGSNAGSRPTPRSRTGRTRRRASAWRRPTVIRSRTRWGSRA